MEKNVLLAVVLCLATLFIWNRFVMPPAQSPTPAATSTKASTAASPQSTAPGAPAAPAAPLVPAAPPAKEQLTTIERPGLYRAVLTSYGAALQSYELLTPKYYTKELRRLREGSNQVEVQKDVPTNLITSYRPALGVRFPGSDFQVPEVRQQVWSLADDIATPEGGRKLVYRWQSADVALQKTFEFPPNSYQVGVTVEVKNLKSAPANHHFEVGLEGFQDPTQKPGGLFAARVVQNETAWDRSGKMQSASLEAVEEGVAADKLRGDLHWIGIGQQYFLLAVALPHGSQVGDKQARVSGERNGSLAVTAEYSQKTLAAGESALYPLTAFAGPKLPELLDDVAVQGQAGGLSTSISYNTLPVLGWLAAPLVRPMLWVLRQLQSLLNSWALAIVLLTMLVKLVTLYPTHKSMKSMKAMADLRPQIEALKEKCGDNKEKFNLEMMALYKKHGINPLGGCLPMLVQMPVWIALYSMLSSAIELYREPFISPRWISDLTLADPFFILPLATGVLMYLQTKLTPPPADPQQKMMANMMPVIFTFFSLFLPAGLTLYILTNTLLGMVQQAVINRNKPALAAR